MKKLSALPAPAVAGVVREKNTRAAIAEIKNCLYHGADMIDLHLSCLNDVSEDAIREIAKSTSLPILALNYNSTYEWENAGYTEKEREALFLRAVDAGCAGVDMQGYTFDAASKAAFHGEDRYSFTKNAPREIVTDESVIRRQMDFIDRIHEKGGEVLLSCHPGIPMNAETVVELALYLEKRGPDIIKIVTAARDEGDMLESIRAMAMLRKEVKTPVAYHSNGKAGLLTRIVNPVMGGQIAFCVDHYNEGSTTEQPEVRTVREVVDGITGILGGRYGEL